MIPRAFDAVGDADRRAGRSHEFVGFCCEPLGLVEVRRKERGVVQRVAEAHLVAVTAEAVDCLSDSSVRLRHVAGAPRTLDGEIGLPRRVPCGPREPEMFGSRRVAFG